MKKTGAFLTVYALEQIGIKHTFGIPGVHNTEIYDELNKSKLIDPVLVTHECGAAFMADGVSRTSGSIGTLVIVPAAGLTHAMSGIGEAYLDGIPMLIISGGTRKDSGRYYQLHQIDQEKILDGIIKKYYQIKNHEDIVPHIFEAYETAVSDEPGPVFVEIPVEIQMFQGEIQELQKYHQKVLPGLFDEKKLEKSVQLLTESKYPGIYVGWGAVDISSEIIKIAESLGAPVATTFQGISAFPGNHPLHAGVGFGPSSIPASQKAFSDCDCLLAVGVRFSELATESYGTSIPERLIHVDINPNVFNKNYTATIAIKGDARHIIPEISKRIKSSSSSEKRYRIVSGIIRKEKKNYLESWMKKRQGNIVSPGFFFNELGKKLSDDTIMVVDDGKHTFLTAELFSVQKSRHFISPTDFNCMGYSVPAAIGAKISNPDKTVVTIVGDGAFLMTGMELLTASMLKLGLIVFIFNDGELGQISQFQKIPLNRKTASILGCVQFDGIAKATGAHYIKMNNDNEISAVIDAALEKSREKIPVLVDVIIDYSKKTYLTKGVVKTNLGRFPTREKLRFIARALKRHITG